MPISQLLGRLKAGLVLCSVLALLPCAANAITVTSGADSGPGTLRQAVADFPASPDTEIVIDNSQVTLITLLSPIVYSDNNKQLVIRSSSTATCIQYDGTGSIALDCSDRNGVKLTDLEFQGGGGLLIDIPETASGIVLVDLLRVDVWNSTGRGILVFDDSNIDGDTTLDLRMHTCDLISNRLQGCFLRKTDGDLLANLTSMSVHLNGFGGAPGVADGVQLCQSGNGKLQATITSYVCSSNSEDGLEIEEQDAGDTDVTVWGFLCEDGQEEGLEISEADDGNCIVDINVCDIYDQKALTPTAGEGVEIRENGPGGINATLCDICILDGDDADFWASEKDGIRIEPEDSGDCSVLVELCFLADCKDEGFQFQEEISQRSPVGTYTGESGITILNSTITRNVETNEGNGIKAGAALTAVDSTLDINNLESDPTPYQGNFFDDLDLDGTPWTELLNLAPDILFTP